MRVALVIIGLIISAHARLNAVIFGQPVSVPALWLVAVAVVLTLAGFVLVMVRLILRDRQPAYQQKPVYVVTTLT
jgi:hypothetical protein